MSLWCEAIRGDVRDLEPLSSATIRAEKIPGVGTMYHQVPRPQSDDGDEQAWFQDITASGVEVTGGPITWANQVLDEAWQTHVKAFAGTPYLAAYPTDPGDYWLYVNAELATGVVTVLFTEDDVYPTDDVAGLVKRFPLSVWRVTAEADTIVTPCTRVFTQHASGRLDVPANFGPPRAP
jgi:hypothetical protein